jgi:two-component system heavy metal sensor histidine kinase CusS
MSSKSAEPRRSRAPGGSIAARLTLLLTVSSFAMLLAGGLSLYWALERTLERENAQFLADKAYVMRGVLRDYPGQLHALDEETRLEGTERQYKRYFTRVLDERGGVVAETPGMDELLPPKIFPEPVAADSPPSGHVGHHTADGIEFSLISAWAAGRPPGPMHVVQVGLDVSNEEDVLASYRRNLLLVLLAGLVVSVLAGGVIARRGLAPLADITRAARNVTAARLHARIAVSAWPRELADLAAAFDEMLVRLEDSFRRLSQFSGDIAHELRTPLTNFLTESQVTLSRARPGEEYRAVLESGVEELARLARLIEMLLFLARAENAEGRIERRALEGRREIATLLDFHSGEAEEGGVALECEGDARIQADPVLFQRAVSNLLSNAVRYTPHGGSVRVILRQTGGGAEVCVVDTGSGIAAEHLPRIFDRFYRPDPSRAHRTGGFGLGLSIVRSIVALHGGDVRIESEPGRGTRITLTFPRAP